MSTESERAIATALREAADGAAPAYPALDSTAVITAGRALVRRRRMVRSGAVLAVAAVVLGGAGIVKGQHDRAADRLPADRKDIGVVSVTLGQAQPYTATDGTVIDGPSRVVVTVDTSAVDRPNVGFYALAGDGSRTLMANETVDLDRPGPLVLTDPDEPHLTFGVVPSTARALLVGGPDSSGDVPRDLRRIPGTQLEAFVSVTAIMTTEAVVSGLTWLDATGRVSTMSTGEDGVTELPTATVDGVTTYVDPNFGWGAFVATGAAVTALPEQLTPTDFTDPLRVAPTAQGSGTTWLVQALVDPAAESPSISFTSSCTQVGSTALARLSDGTRSVLQARCTTSQGADTIVASLAYTVDGTPRTMLPVAPYVVAVPAEGWLTVPAVGAEHPAEGLSVAQTVDPPTAPGQWVSFRRLLFDGQGLDTAASFPLAPGADATFQLGDGGGYDMAYGLTRSRPTAVTPVGSPASRFAAGTAWATVKVPGTDLWAVAISLTGTDDHSPHQLVSVEWTDASGQHHTTPAG